MTNRIQPPEQEPERDSLEDIPIASESKRRFNGRRNKAKRQLSNPNNRIMLTKIDAVIGC
jgi:hypothetical protein